MMAACLFRHGGEEGLLGVGRVLGSVSDSQAGRPPDQARPQILRLPLVFVNR